MFERNKIQAANVIDKYRNPAGGSVTGPRLHIIWQDDPLGRPTAEPNGAFVESFLYFYQCNGQVVRSDRFQHSTE